MNDNMQNQTHETPGPNVGNIVFGIWVAVSPFVLGFARLQAAMWNNVAVGLAVLILAFGAGPRNISRVVNVLLGLWLIASPFVLAFAAPVPFWNNIILGILIAAVALIAGAERTTEVTPPPR